MKRYMIYCDAQIYQYIMLRLMPQAEFTTQI